jgi:NAD/NADP transhydrogenase beta subunit
MQRADTRRCRPRRPTVDGEDGMNPDIVLACLIAFYIFMVAVLMIAGMVVGSSGTPLTVLMAKAKAVLAQMVQACHDRQLQRTGDEHDHLEIR